MVAIIIVVFHVGYMAIAMEHLSRIDVPIVLFFLGILMAVGALESMLTLNQFATYLANTLGDNRIIITLIGLLSAVVDNVPLVASEYGYV